MMHRQLHSLIWDPDSARQELSELRLRNGYKPGHYSELCDVRCDQGGQYWRDQPRVVTVSGPRSTDQSETHSSDDHSDIVNTLHYICRVPGVLGWSLDSSHYGHHLWVSKKSFKHYQPSMVPCCPLKWDTAVVSSEMLGDENFKHAPLDRAGTSTLTPARFWKAEQL